MVDAQRNFYKRERSLRRKHTRMARGYVTKIDKNGVIVQTPDSKAGGIGLRIVVMVAFALIGLKVLILSFLGADSYGAHLAVLEASDALPQKLGAWLMQSDPVTGFIVETIRQFMV